MPKTAVVGPQKNMARLTKVYNTDDDDSSYVGRRHLPLVAGDKLMVSFEMLKCNLKEGSTIVAICCCKIVIKLKNYDPLQPTYSCMRVYLRATVSLCVCVRMRLCAHCQTFITRTRATVCYVRSTHMHRCIYIHTFIHTFLHKYIYTHRQIHRLRP